MHFKVTRLGYCWRYHSDPLLASLSNIMPWGKRKRLFMAKRRAYTQMPDWATKSFIIWLCLQILGKALKHLKPGCLISSFRCKIAIIWDIPRLISKQGTTKLTGESSCFLLDGHLIPFWGLSPSPRHRHFSQKNRLWGREHAKLPQELRLPCGI